MKKSILSTKILLCDFDSFLVKQEKKLMEEFNLSEKLVHKLVRHKPMVLLYEEEYEKNQTGIKAVYQVFGDEMKMSRE